MSFIQTLADQLTGTPVVGIVGHTRTSGLDLLHALETALGDHVHQVRRARGAERITLTNGTVIELHTRNSTNLRGRSLSSIVTDYIPDSDELDVMRLNVMTQQGTIRHIDGTLLAA